MKNSIITLILALFVCSFVQGIFAQESLEREAIAFSVEYQTATNNKNVTYLEKHLDDNFISLGFNSSIISKADAIAQARKPVEKQDFKVIEVKGIPLKTISSGNMVVLISNWKVVRQANSATNAPPQVDSGSTTAVYQKTDVWRILSEHVSFNRSPPANDIGEIGRTSEVFNRALVFRNYNDAESLMGPRYVRVDETGISISKASFLSDLRSGKLVILSSRTKNVYINRRENSAVETGTIELKGKNAGADFAKILDYARMWTKTGDQWKVTADYFTVAEP